MSQKSTKGQFRFLEWQVYKDARKLFVFVLGLVKKLPKEYRYELGSQVIRATLSVLLNIAEGSGKGYDTEMNRFFGIATGSLSEVLAATDAMRHAGLVTEEEFGTVYSMVDGITSQLVGFRKTLRS